MTRLITLALVLLLGLTLLALPGGCPNPTGNGTGTTEDDGSGDSHDSTNGDTTDDAADDDQDDGDGSTACGTRTVDVLPPAGYLKYTVAAELEADPADSTLAKVIFQAALCPQQQGATTAPLYQIDAGGSVVAIWSLIDSGDTKVTYSTAVTGQRFVIEDGCLHADFDTPDTEDDPNDVVNPPENACGLGTMPVSRAGIEWEPTGEYICVEVHATSACRDCWVADGVWYETIVTSGYYVSLGTLDGITLYGWAAVCDPDHEDATGTITTGDRVDFTWTYTTTYEVSASPAELGYTEIQYAP